MSKIFCVEDDANIRELVLYTLNATGFEAKGFESGTELFERIKEELPDLVLLDIMLPGMDGMEILEILKREYNDLPVIMVTAKSDQIDKIKGLDNGADDIITEDDSFVIYTAPDKFLTVKKALEDMNAVFITSEITYVASNTIEIADDEVKEKVFALIDALEELDDVNAVYHNMED